VQHSMRAEVHREADHEGARAPRLGCLRFGTREQDLLTSAAPGVRRGSTTVRRLPADGRFRFVGRVLSSGHAAREPVDEVLSAAEGALRAGKRAAGGIVVGASDVAAVNGRDIAP
jgi:hypothetical protein